LKFEISNLKFLPQRRLLNHPKLACHTADSEGLQPGGLSGLCLFLHLKFEISNLKFFPQ